MFSTDGRRGRSMPGRRTDLTGRRVGRLTVLHQTERKLKPNGRVERIKWVCRCECGNDIEVRATHLSSGAITSCGCLRRETTSKRVSIDLVGQSFGEWIVLGRADCGDRPGWRCRCSCGHEENVITSNLTRGLSKSCGCSGEYGLLPDDPAVIYLIVNEDLGAVKIGIAKAGSARLDQHRRHGWREELLVETVGLEARRAERAVLDLWRGHGVPEGVTAEQMPQAGHTETAPVERVDLVEIKRLLVGYGDRVTASGAGDRVA